jgi:uncharacterized protein (DUF427 family)
VNRCVQNKVSGTPLADQVRVDAGLPAILYLPFRSFSTHLIKEAKREGSIQAKGIRIAAWPPK